MNYLLAKSAGFCFGVQRALALALQTAEETTETIYTFGPLIHNEQEVERLKANRIVPVERLEDIPAGCCILIRTHGVPAELQAAIEQKTSRVVDATCPFVKKIHNIVREHAQKGFQIVIVGDTTHPEVVGINGWCDQSAIVVQTPEQIAQITTKKPLCFVAQTTFSTEIWEKIKKFAKTTCKHPLLFDTICSATEERQTEAKEIASKVDAMIVVGGRHSSNTKKLVDICSGSCLNTYHIETLSELPESAWSKGTIGVTAGASTPEWIIKEVTTACHKRKSEETQKN